MYHHFLLTLTGGITGHHDLRAAHQYTLSENSRATVNYLLIQESVKENGLDENIETPAITLSPWTERYQDAARFVSYL